jgi:hypothetical protein
VLLTGGSVRGWRGHRAVLPQPGWSGHAGRVAIMAG